jgi:hypothetical protein
MGMIENSVAPLTPDGERTAIEYFVGWLAPPKSLY